MISTAFSIVNLLPGDVRKAKEVLKIVDELISAAASFRHGSRVAKTPTRTREGTRVGAGIGSALRMCRSPME